MKKHLFCLLLWAFFMPATPALADALDDAMAPIVESYLQITTALAGDQNEGVQASAERIAQLATTIRPKASTAANAQYLEGLSGKIQSAAQALAAASTLDAQRKALKGLSQALSLYATVQEPPGLHVVYCPMAAAPWLQKDKAVKNPYYGASMLKCGNVVEAESP